MLWGVNNSITLTRNDSIFPAFHAVGQQAVINLSALRWVMSYIAPNAIREANQLASIDKNKEAIDKNMLNEKSSFHTVPLVDH